MRLEEVPDEIQATGMEDVTMSDCWGYDDLQHKGSFANSLTFAIGRRISVPKHAQFSHEVMQCWISPEDPVGSTKAEEGASHHGPFL